MSSSRFAMVSEWMINGNINEFIEAHWGVNRFELVGFSFPSLAEPVAYETASGSSKMLLVD